MTHKNIEYTYEGLVLIRKFLSDATIVEQKESILFMLKNNIIIENQIGIISDFSDVNFLVDQKDLSLLKDIFFENYQILGNLKYAQIITSPQIAQTIFFEIENKDVKTRSFSTFKAANTWIRN